MTDEIIIVKRTPDEFGTMTEKKVAVRGRFEYKTRMVRNLQGEMVVASGRASIEPMAVTHADKVIFEQKEYSILNIDRARDFSTKFIKLDVA